MTGPTELCLLRLSTDFFLEMRQSGHIILNKIELLHTGVNQNIFKDLNGILGLCISI